MTVENATKDATPDGAASVLTAGLGELLKLKSLAMRSHYSCEDCWYSCPKSADGCCNDAEGDECNCGADKHNAEVEALFQAMSSAPNAALTGAEGVRVEGTVMHLEVK